MKKINFKQPKYIIPTIAYFGLLLIGYFVISIVGFEAPEKDSGLKSTEYLNSDLPAANVPKNIGSKRKNVREAFGNISDLTALEDFSENPDTTYRKKEDYESKYSEEDQKLLDEQKRQREELERLRKENEALRSGHGSAAVSRGGNAFAGQPSLPMTEEERSRILQQRRSGLYADLDRDLNNVRSRGAARVDQQAAAQDSMERVLEERKSADESNAVKSLDDDADTKVVVKLKSDASDYFTTISENECSSNLIRAIIDEEVKAVDGSRVRLRLLDGIDISGVTIPKGSYLYATMSGFAKQRVQGKVSSVLVGDEILKISLSLYDSSDGLEGLYVPESQFRETAKDIGSSAMSGSLNTNDMMGSSTGSLMQFATRAVQSATQRATNAAAKAIKKNRVRLKYGTQVYLVNGRTEKKR